MAVKQQRRAVLTREEIFNNLRGIEYDGQDRSLMRISRIRPKIGDDPVNPKRIKTVRSKGYLFVKENLRRAAIFIRVYSGLLAALLWSV